MTESRAETRPAAAVARTVLSLGRRARAAGLGVTTGRLLDSLRSLEAVRLEDREEVRLALRANLASSREEQEIFDRLFEELFLSPSERPPTRVEIERSVAPEDSDEEAPPSPLSDATERDQASWGRGEVERAPDLAAGWPGGSKAFDRAVDSLLRKLSTRPSRRHRASRRGARVDVRGSFRRNVRHGLDVVELLRRRRKIRKTRVVLLCDVSGSMEEATPFLLRFLFALQKRLSGSRTAVFSTRFTDVTRALRRRGVRSTLEQVARIATHWSGGTDIGAALAALNRTVVGAGSARSTVTIVVSDGYDQGDPARLGREMALLGRRCRRIVWINPLLGTEGYAPLARGMRAALPHVDHFLPGNDAAALRRLGAELRGI